MLNYEFPPVGGGASPVTYELCKQLARTGHLVDVVTMRYDSLPTHETKHGVNIYRTPAIRLRPDICHIHEMLTYFPGALPLALQLSRTVRYDIIHCHFIIPSGPLAWLVSRLTNLPFVITCHGSDVPGHNPDRFGLAHKLLLPVWHLLVRCVPLLVSPSEALKTLIKKHFPQADVAIIPNGINASSYSVTKTNNSILMCSRILPGKGFQYALQAIIDMQLDWPINIVGDGPYLSELKHIAANAKTPIKFWGWLDQYDPCFRQLYETNTIFVFPSEAENFPTVLLEAMSAGMAIITSTAGGCPEVVGPAARLVPPRDADAIRRQLEELVHSPEDCARLGRLARERAEQFSWASVAQQYVQCYHRVIENWGKSK